MILSEDEAKTKWCAMVRFSQFFNDVVSNRPFDNEGTHCIASACMMWEWNKKYNGLMNGGKEAKYINDGGYCGLSRRNP
jgi:hypothetical protein